MENDMSKTHKYFQQELGLDKKTSEAIKILMDEGLLEPLIVELMDALEAKEYQNTTSGGNSYPLLKKTKEVMTPIEAELVESSGLPLKTVREIPEEN